MPEEDKSGEKPGARIEIKQEIGQNPGSAEALHIDYAEKLEVVLPPLPPPSFGGAIPASRLENYLPRGEIEEQARARLLRKEAAAIIGVRAPGGLGKTELAIRLANELKGQFQGVLWVEMKDKTPAQVVGELAQAIAIFTAIGARYHVAAQTGNYGWTLYNLDRKDQARPYLLRAAGLFEAMGLLDYAERHRRAAEE